MRLLSVLVVLFAAVGVRAADPDARAAANRALAFLAKDGLAWKDDRKCASCHHVPMTLWTLNEAKKAGFAVNEKVLADLTAWSAAADDKARVIQKPDPKA